MLLNRTSVLASFAIAIIIVVVYAMLSSRGAEDPVVRPALVIETPRPADGLAQGAARTPVHQITPKGALTEEAVIRLSAEAIANRDLEALRTLSAPEQSADLWRLHSEDPARFWNRGRLWVDDVSSGVTIAKRDEDSEEAWRVLVRFGNGREETMTFTRIRGALKIMRF